MKVIRSRMVSRHSTREPRWMHLPGLATGRELGLGELVKRLTLKLGIRPCDRCNRRARWLDRRLVFYGGTASVAREDGLPWPLRLCWFAFVRGRTRRASLSVADPCSHFAGSCTGLGSHQCVSGPARLEPDAEIIEQCCNGWFQYPWIEVCPDQPARSGCGFCLW